MYYITLITDAYALVTDKYLDVGMDCCVQLLRQDGNEKVALDVLITCIDKYISYTSSSRTDTSTIANSAPQGNSLNHIRLARAYAFCGSLYHTVGDYAQSQLVYVCAKDIIDKLKSSTGTSTSTSAAKEEVGRLEGIIVAQLQLLKKYK